jgi:hypothetical protein
LPWFKRFEGDRVINAMINNFSVIGAADGLLYLKKGGYRKFKNYNATVDFIRQLV